jgi:hypothetical protein
MARSTAKTILFARQTVDGKTLQWPVAVFNDLESTKAYATMVKMAHASGNAEHAKTLDPGTLVDKNGKLHPGLKFSIKEVPYAPAPTFGEAELFGEDETPTA